LPATTRLIRCIRMTAAGTYLLVYLTGGLEQEEWPNIAQAVEGTPDEHVVWALQDLKNLRPATTAQFLDEPGVPERHGDLGH
jgi:hypothetical protein